MSVHVSRKDPTWVTRPERPKGAKDSGLKLQVMAWRAPILLVPLYSWANRRKSLQMKETLYKRFKQESPRCQTMQWLWGESQTRHNPKKSHSTAHSIILADLLKIHPIPSLAPTPVSLSVCPLQIFNLLVSLDPHRVFLNHRMLCIFSQMSLPPGEGGSKIG